ncbi:MAG: tetratricopeptide repeat protein [Calditrichaeota bacterium]|nr:MAG: tetratricopeptide repeat protein [Calditrichota bacterium]
MQLSRLFIVIAMASLFCIPSGCVQKTATLDEALALYRQNKLEQALPLFESLAAQEDRNPEARSWLAETYRRLGRKEEAVKTARQALALDPRSSFAHTVIAEASNPVMGEWSQANADTTWTHLMQAVAGDSTDGHPWLIIFGESMHRGKPAMMRRALRAMVESGFLTKAALSYGRWMLRGLPSNAILFTNGDMDTYPPCAVQEIEGLRPDVYIINRGTLETLWHARFIRDHLGVPLPVDDAWLDQFTAYQDEKGNLVTLSDEIFHRWIEQKSHGSFDRPIAVAVTVEERYWASCQDNMRFAGAFFHWQAASVATTSDIPAMLASLEGMTPDDFTGPWVSERDRSPIRRLYTRNLVRNVTETAIMCSESLLEAKQIADASRWANWADELDRKAELGPRYHERIAQIKKQL